MSERVTFYIDGQEVQANKGDNLLKVARENGFDIPGLCFYEKISKTGDCRLCMVKIEGRPGLVPSCLSPVEAGMKVTAFDAELEATRKMLADILLSEHNDDCITCDKDGDCGLQDLAYRYDLDTPKRNFPPVWKEITQVAGQHLPGPLVRLQQVHQMRTLRQGLPGDPGKRSPQPGPSGNPELCGGRDRKLVRVGMRRVRRMRSGLPGRRPGGKARLRHAGQEKRYFQEGGQTTCPYCGVGCQLELWVKDNKIVKVKGADRLPQ